MVSSVACSRRHSFGRAARHCRFWIVDLVGDWAVGGRLMAALKHISNVRTFRSTRFRSGITLMPLKSCTPRIPSSANWTAQASRPASRLDDDATTPWRVVQRPGDPLRAAQEPVRPALPGRRIHDGRNWRTVHSRRPTRGGLTGRRADKHRWLAAPRGIPCQRAPWLPGFQRRRGSARLQVLERGAIKESSSRTGGAAFLVCAAPTDLLWACLSVVVSILVLLLMLTL